ncbi:hypothetical protein HDU96_003705 [Phlyctochytrium bullatum]|nr:hypothetical protein HDU96_003705 [Phlyctochytrium bullatum]
MATATTTNSRLHLTRVSERGTDGKADVLDAPAPWNLQVSKAFVIPYVVGSHNAESIKKLLPEDLDKTDFLGEGLAMLMLIRYGDTPVGPYDELLLISGAHKARGKQTSASNPRAGKLLADRRIPFIWVSSEASLRQGRKNWGIRKELADFTWVDSADGSVRVTVRERHSRPGSPAGTLLLDMSLNCPLGPFVSIPATTWGPLSYLLPPIVEPRIDEEGNRIGGWLVTSLSFSGWVRPAKVVEFHATGPAFPDAKGLGLYPGGMVTGTLSFLEPEFLEDDEEN